MKEFRFFEKHLTAKDGEGVKSLTLRRNDLINCQVVVLISGAAKSSLSTYVNILVPAGAKTIDLADMSDLVYDVAGSPGGCIMQINFPIHGLELQVKPDGADINITIYGGNR